MNSSTPDALPDQVAADASVAGNARLTALIAKLADLAPFVPEIVTLILGFPAA
jgi:hypothetical protein